MVGSEFFGASVEHGLSAATHEFFDEGGGDAVGAFDDEVGYGFGEGETAGVEGGEFAATFGIGQREFDGLVDAAGASRKGGFELFGSVRGENEEDRGIFTETIHFVEEFVEERFFAGVAHVATVAGDKIDIFHDDDGGLKKAGEGHVFAQKAKLPASDEKGGVLGKLAGEVMDGVGFACAGRAVEKEALFHAEFQAAELGAMTNELGDVAFEESDGLFGENYFVARDAAEFVDADGAGFARVGTFVFEGENLTAVAAPFGDGLLKAGHQLARKVEAGFAGRNRDFDDDAFGAAIVSVGSEKNREGSVADVAEPKGLLEAAGRFGLAEIDFVVLKRSNEDGVIAVGPKLGEFEGFVTPLLVEADEFVGGILGDEVFERFLKIDTGGDGKGARGGGELGNVEAAKMFAEEIPGEGFGFRGGRRFLALFHG